MKMSVKIILVAVLILLVAVLIGCTNDVDSSARQSKMVKKELPAPNAALVKAELEPKLSNDKLMVIYDEAPLLKPGDIETDYLMIRNAYDKGMQFRFENLCETCMITFFQNEVTIEPEDSALIGFKIESEGSTGIFKQGIKIYDGLNNAYAYYEMAVKVER
ncbi:MAG: hypothetical protein ACE5DM_06135 [Candidatus Nanoarchaeia archaeon]